MNTGLNLVIPGADFSANNVGNGIFPSFANLKQALFYGNAIPDLTALKKSKGLNLSTLGNAAFQDQTIKIAAGDTFPSVIQKLPNNNCSIAMVISRGGAANKTNTLFIAAKSGNEDIARAGDIVFKFFETPAGLNTDMQLDVQNVITANLLRASIPSVSPYFIVVATLDSATKTVEFHMSNDFGKSTKTAVATALQANGSLYNTDAQFRITQKLTGGLHLSSLAIFDKALNEAEVKELVDYYKEFYKDAPAPV